MPIDPRTLDDKGLQNFIDNYRRKSATDQQAYIDALAEQAKRNGRGLDFATTMRVIKEAASQGRYISYGELAEQSGADWNKVRYAMGPHLDALLEYCHRNGLPLLSAIVVNRPNLKSGKLEPELAQGICCWRASAWTSSDKQRIIFAGSAGQSIRMGSLARTYPWGTRHLGSG